jgi:hypothetical protein
MAGSLRPMSVAMTVLQGEGCLEDCFAAHLPGRQVGVIRLVPMLACWGIASFAKTIMPRRIASRRVGVAMTFIQGTRLAERIASLRSCLLQAA